VFSSSKAPVSQPARSALEPASALPSDVRAQGLASASMSDTLAQLQVNPATGLTPAQVEARRQAHGYNEVAEAKRHPIRAFLGKFWGVSAWMLELIMILSAVLGKYSDLAIHDDQLAVTEAVC
jgi:magnesium-transporting ATPase (P-type)